MPVQTTSLKYVEMWFSTAVSHPQIVRRGDEGNAGSEAGAENPEASVAPLLEPVQAGSRIDDRLSSGMQGPAHIARHMIVGPLDARGLPPVVVSQAHAKGGQAEKIQQLAEPEMAAFIRIPLREHEHCPAPVARAWKEFGVNRDCSPDKG